MTLSDASKSAYLDQEQTWWTYRRHRPAARQWPSPHGLLSFGLGEWNEMGAAPTSCICLGLLVCDFIPFGLMRQDVKCCMLINPLTPNDRYSGRTTPLTSKRCILYIYSTNIGTEYFKHGIYSPYFSSSKYSLFHKSNVFGSCIIHILYTGCAKN